MSSSDCAVIWWRSRGGRGDGGQRAAPRFPSGIQREFSPSAKAATRVRGARSPGINEQLSEQTRMSVSRVPSAGRGELF